MLMQSIQKILQKMGYQLVHYKGNKVHSNKLNFIDASIDLEKFEFLVRGKDLLHQLVKEYNAKVELNNLEQIEISINDLKFVVNTWEEILILNEVFCVGMYNYVTAEDYLLIDIGMNVGITSLFHSNKTNCKKIFSFEPFESTITLANQNFKLNKTFDKIKVHNIGLGFPTRALEINYSAEYKGSVGINGVADYVNEETKNTNVAILNIVDIAEVVTPIFDENNALLKLMKIDAEGVEYEILERLSATGLIKQIDAFMIEWHLKGPKELEDVLSRNGFKMVSFNTKNKQIGMLYAFNTAKV